MITPIDPLNKTGERSLLRGFIGNCGLPLKIPWELYTRNLLFQIPTFQDKGYHRVLCVLQTKRAYFKDPQEGSLEKPLTILLETTSK